MITGAKLSNCQKYRYKLWRFWDMTKPKVLFIMLNPSTADHTKDDPTVRRCINFAKSWGYGGIYIGNLYAYRSRDPKKLKGVENPIGNDNEFYLDQMAGRVEKIVCAWGNKQGEPNDMIKNLGTLHYLELCKDGTPKHPLYLKNNLKPILYL